MIVQAKVAASRFKWPLVGVFLLAVAWSVLAAVFPPVIAPPLDDIFTAVIGYLSDSEFYRALWLTFYTFAVSIVIAIALGTCMSGLSCWKPQIAGVLAPVVGLLNAVPGISWLGLAIIWFGIGNGPTRFLVVVSGTPVFISAISQAFNDRDPRFDELRAVFHVPAHIYLRKMIIPQVIGPAFAAVQAMLGLGWKLTIMGEFLSSSRGLGRLLFDAKSNFQTDRVIALTLLIVAMWGIINMVFVLLRSVSLPINNHGYSRGDFENA